MNTRPWLVPLVTTAAAIAGFAFTTVTLAGEAAGPEPAVPPLYQLRGEDQASADRVSPTRSSVR